MIRTCLNYSATDPRDNIFAFVGLAKDCEDLRPSPDYTASVQEISTLAIRAVYQESIDSLALDIDQKLPGLVEGGMLGLCPKAAESGDEMHRVYGASVPFVLRQHAADVGPGHTLVGCYYLHDFIKGEVLVLKIDVEQITSVQSVEPWSTR